MSSKLKDKQIRISSPFDVSSHKTERTANQKFVEWINQIVKEKNLPLGLAEQETVGADRKQPDIVIYESPRSNNVLCLIELKPPYFSPFDEEELKRPAWEKANKRKAKYFATSNFQWLIWFNTERVNRMESEERQVIDKFYLSNVESLDDIEDARFKSPIIKGIERFLEELVTVHTGIKPEPLLPIDEFLIFRLQEKIYRLAKYYNPIIRDKVHKDADFSKKFSKWFIEQQWTFAYSDSDFEKAARQTAYLLINKILFYDVLQSKRSGYLDPLTIPDDLTKGGLLEKSLQGYFDYVLNNIDYETIYSTDFIDHVAFPENRAVVEEIKELIKILKRYDFSKIGFDIIGRIFERLIPQDERHNLGQYFTNPDIVDLISKFCIRHEDDKVLDPSCGAGTFLVRAYQHKKLMNLRKPHQEILKTIWGMDIAKFPAHLSTINLAVNDLSVDEKLKLHELLPLQHFTEPPPRYTDATLVKALEEYGIGRPSTYAPTISTILERGYVERTEKKFHPTEIGKVVNDLLVKHFSKIVDYQFTAHMEKQLDEIAEGQLKWRPVIREFYEPFKANIKEKQATVKKQVEQTDIPCPVCEKPMVKKFGRFGQFLACSDYPKCKGTKPLPEEEAMQKKLQAENQNITCPKCGQGELVIKRGKYGYFLGCSRYPECDYIGKLEKKTGITCPKCGQGELVEKLTRKKRIFWGCNRYPECDYATWEKPKSE